jgi:hypothetical protein
MRGSNPRLLAHKTNTLPTELMELLMAKKMKKRKSNWLLKYSEKKSKIKRDVLELNQRPIGLQPIALPLS